MPNLKTIFLFVSFISISFSYRAIAQNAGRPQDATPKARVTQYQLDSALADELNTEYDSIDWYYVAKLLVHGASVNTCNATNENLLYLAIHERQDSMIHYLLQNGAKVNLKPGNPYSPLKEACTTDNYLATKWLLDLGANANGVVEYGRRPIHFVSDTNIALLLLQKGAMLNQADSQGYTPLHGACADGNYFLCRFYVRHGARINAISNDGDSPLDMATNEDVKEYLLKKGARNGKKGHH